MSTPRWVVVALVFFGLVGGIYLVNQYSTYPNPTPTIKLIPTSTSLPTPTSKPVITVGLVGDLGLGRHITSTARAKNNFNWSFQEIAPWTDANTFTLANLESPIIPSCPEGKAGTFTFCGDERFVPFLKKYNYFLNLNNNHILNYRLQGLVDTQKFLSEANIPNFYDGLLVEDVNGIKLGFLGYDFITYPSLEPQTVINDIKSARPQVDFLIVSVHWGNEYLPQPEKWRIDLAHQMIDVGADIVHGHHPHVWQGVEKYQDKLIFYSLGNFIFDQSWSYETSHSQIARLQLQVGEPLSYELFPIEIRSNSQPVLMP